MPNLAEIAKKRTTGTRKPTAKTWKPVTGNRKLTTSIAVRVVHPYAEIAKDYNDGLLSWGQIADKHKIKRSSMNGISDRLAVGIVVNGKTIKIDRSKRKK